MKYSFLIAVCLMMSCSSTQSFIAPVSEDILLPTGRIDEAGLDERYLNGVLRDIAKNEDHKIHSMLVARHGKLVLEAYFNEQQRETPHDLRSATKSITSLLTGIAIDKGVFEGVDDHLMDYLGPAYPEIKDKEGIELRHLLMMQNGLDCHDSDRKTKGQEDRMYRSGDWVSYFLSLDTTFPPGDTTRYCTGGVVALGEALSQAADEDMADFADRTLFAPLGIKNYAWSRFDRGQKVDTGGHLYLSSQGMMKIGMLVSQKGIWNGQRIVSEAWIEESTRPHTEIDHNPYGYLWWHNTVKVWGKDVDVISARGNGGQTIFIAPAYDLVAVFTAGYYNSEDVRIVYQIFFNPVLASLIELQ